MRKKSLSALVSMEDPDAVLSEINHIFSMVYPQNGFKGVTRVFTDIKDLFSGNYAGYRACNIHYHDLKHTTDCMLALMRLIHGGLVAGRSFEERNVRLALIAALMHDTGYLQTEDDPGGTGAKYTLVHVDRSIEFMKHYLLEHTHGSRDIAFCESMLRCTGLETRMTEINFLSKENEVLGHMLGTADLLGQMADRTYLERLPFLYREYVEGGVNEFESEFDFLQKTPGFFDRTRSRFIHELGGVYRDVRHHFRVRWGIDADLYMDTISNAIQYLQYILEHHPTDYRSHLRQGYMREIEALCSDLKPNEKEGP